MLPGYIAIVLMGVTLGLIGGGGSILTVPILVYMFGVEPVLATAYSLLVVGATALAGSLGYLRRSQVDVRAVCAFGIPSLAGVFLVRKFLVPALPDPVFTLWGHAVDKGLLVMVAFATVMLLAALAMLVPWRGSGAATPAARRGHAAPAVAAEGLVVGGVTGFVGAGGGFLIVPSLIYFVGLPMKKAVGTSLAIIAVKSLLGATGDLGRLGPEDFRFVISLVIAAILGSVAGAAASRRISGERLKRGFGWFVVACALAILARELAGG